MEPELYYHVHRNPPTPRSSVIFNKVVVYGEELRPLPNSKLECHPLSAVRNYLFKIFPS
jgi:hypothetical protein